MKQVTPQLFWPVVAGFAVWLSVLTWTLVGRAPSVAERAAADGGPVVAFVHGDSLHGLCPNHAGQPSASAGGA